MTITSNDGYLAAARQNITWTKTATRPTIAAQWYTLFDLAGNPGAGTLNVGNTANGIVPTDAIAGYPAINAFGVGADGALGGVDFGSTVACRILLFDCVFACGAYVFNANTALSAQPSFAGRIPGTVYNGQTELWAEAVTATTGNLAVNVTYTNGDGVAAQTTGATGIGAVWTLGRSVPLPFQAGDRGVQLITNVQGTVATAGTFNVRVLRRLGFYRCRLANDGDSLSYLKTRLRQLYANSALYVLIAADGTSSGVPSMNFEVVNG